MSQCENAAVLTEADVIFQLLRKQVEVHVGIGGTHVNKDERGPLGKLKLRGILKPAFVRPSKKTLTPSVEVLPN